MTAGDRVELYGTATFDAGGRATVELGPVPWAVSYELGATTVATDLGTAPRTKAEVFRNSAVASNRLDVTETRGNGSTTDTPIRLYGGERLVIVWTGGTAGARATATATGEVA